MMTVMKQHSGARLLVVALVALLPMLSWAFFHAVPSQTALQAMSRRARSATSRVMTRDIRVSAQETTTDDEPMIGPALPPTPAAAPEPVPEEELSAEEKARKEKLEKIEKLKAKEVFQTKETGDFECQVCGWQYKEVDGFGPYKPGTPFAALDSSFRCPKCKAEKKSFVPVTMTIAGFVDNSKYGLGGNNLTSEQKSGLIFGSLLFFFFLFLSGYLLE